MKPTFRISALAMAVACAIGTAHAPDAEANVASFSWRGAFTFLNQTGQPYVNSPADYASGYYGNGDGTFLSGAPYYPGNVPPGADCTNYSPACITAHGWYGNRTPVSGTLSFDTSSGAGVGTINPFFFLGDTPGSGPGTSIARPQNVTFQVIDTVGTILGSMLFSWNGGGHSVSIVLDGSGFLANLPALVAGGATSTVSGVGALPATNGLDFDPSKSVKTYPIGPAPIATKTTNTGVGCDGLALATQVNAYTINTNFANVATCTTGMVDDGIGGSPTTTLYTFNFDITSVHYDVCWDCGPGQLVPVPPAVWLFGSGLAGLMAIARRRRNQPGLKR